MTERGSAGVQGIDPRTGQLVAEPTQATTPEQLEMLVHSAARAAPAWSATSATRRAAALRRVAAALDDGGDGVIQLADLETGLGRTRLVGELARTIGQLRLFAGLIERGEHLDVVISESSAEIGRPDLRRMLQARGPVVVFGASNFPFAFSVIGGDTASALAAGCPVVVKAHEGHPATSAATAALVTQALAEADVPEGVFGVAFGAAIGGPLVAHPEISAVGFTGSFAAAVALQAIAAGRDRPIPFYGELGSANPAIVLPVAAASRPKEIAEAYVASLTLGTGQFCTKPGLLFAPTESSVLKEASAAVAASTGGPALTRRIRDGYRSFTPWDGLPVIATGASGDAVLAMTPELRAVKLADFAAKSDELALEHFGPAGLLITYPDVAELLATLPRLPGSLAGAVQADAADARDAARVAEVLRRRVGRLIMNGWPTGVAVCAAQHHGGPWPATTDAHYTSVGTKAIERWLVPIAYQNWPDELLPEELRRDNPLGVPRQIEA
jgi:NADP-dependent aldehyde dehydrogenase